jgi:hypothetical protein
MFFRARDMHTAVSSGTETRTLLGSSYRRNSEPSGAERFLAYCFDQLLADMLSSTAVS